MAKARAIVEVGDKQFEIQQFEMPRISSDDALMRVEACGICGSDVDRFLKNDRIYSKELTIRDVKTADFDTFAIAAMLLEAHQYPFEKIHSHSFTLNDSVRVIKPLAGRVAGEQAVSVSLDPKL